VRRALCSLVRPHTALTVLCRASLHHPPAVPDFLLLMRESNDAVEALREERLERAIGVVYRPDTERTSHYTAHSPKVLVLR
jgi:erythromycin esterase-like protein